MATQLTVGILGTGRMARLHLEALAQLRDSGLVIGGERHDVGLAVYGRHSERVTALCDEFGVERRSTDLDSFVADPAISVIDNCLTTVMHYDPLQKAIEAGKHVFTDKPLAMEVDEAERLWRMAEAKGVSHGIVQNMRFQSGPALAKTLLERGELGQVFHARVVFGYFVPRETNNRPSWFYRRSEAGGGIVHDMMAHFFDLLRWMFGPIERIYCQGRTYIPERLDETGKPFTVDVEDASAVVLEFASGAMASILASWVRRKNEEVPYFDIDGQTASLRFSFNDLRIQREEGAALFSYDPTVVQADPTQGWDRMALQAANPFSVQLESFLRSIVTGEAYAPDWGDALINQRLIEVAYESMASGRAVDARPAQILD